MNKLSYTLNPYVISKSFSFYLHSFEVQENSAVYWGVVNVSIQS